MAKTRKKERLVQFQRGQLIDTYLCDLHTRRANTIKGRSPWKQFFYKTIGTDIVNSTNEPFELTKNTVERFLEFQTTHNKWFKFVLFEYDDQKHIYVIQGNSRNKHTLCILKGVLEQTRGDPLFDELRTLYTKLVQKKHTGSLYTLYQLKQRLQTLVQLYYPCMPVLVAGAGTVNEDGSICLNNKSGHYAPSIRRIHKAGTLFTEITGRAVHVQAYDRAALRKRYSKDYKNEGSICV